MESGRNDPSGRLQSDDEIVTTSTTFGRVSECAPPLSRSGNDVAQRNPDSFVTRTSRRLIGMQAEHGCSDWLMGTGW